MSNTISIRFLKQGNLTVHKPDSFDKWDKQKQLEWAEDILSGRSDKELIEAMSDYDPMDYSFFDETPQVACIEDEQNNYNKVYTTPEWEAFIGNTKFKG